MGDGQLEGRATDEGIPQRRLDKPADRGLQIDVAAIQKPAHDSGVSSVGGCVEQGPFAARQSPVHVDLAHVDEPAVKDPGLGRLPNMPL